MGLLVELDRCMDDFDDICMRVSCRAAVAFWDCYLGIYMVLLGLSVLGFGKGMSPVR